MAFLFKLKKKEEITEPPKPPEKVEEKKAEDINNLINESKKIKEEKSEKSAENLKPIEKIEKDETHKEENVSKTETNKDQIDEPLNFDFDLDKELQELESKIINDVEPKENEEINKSVEEKIKQEEIQTTNLKEHIIYSSKTKQYFIKSDHLKNTLEKLNMLMELYQNLKEESIVFDKIKNNKKEILSKKIRNINFIFNKTMEIDSIIKGENYE